jgi:TetR/AcrR family transcriptional repressor of nem operon
MKKSTVTRLDILNKAFSLIYKKGYQTTSIDDILATTNVTKGAFYYHFKNKDVMGKAILDEIVKPNIKKTFADFLNNSHDPLDNIYNLIHNLLLENDFLEIQYGCPASNLIQEMTPWNVEFSLTLLELTDTLQQGIIEVINKGIKDGAIKNEMVAEQAAFFVMSGYWGIRNFGKLYNDDKYYHAYLKELKVYLNNFK